MMGNDYDASLQFQKVNNSYRHQTLIIARFVVAHWSIYATVACCGFEGRGRLVRVNKFVLVWGNRCWKMYSKICEFVPHKKYTFELSSKSLFKIGKFFVVIRFEGLSNLFRNFAFITEFIFLNIIQTQTFRV